ncbi:threonine--tRNA ligase [Nocardioides marmotae]|uniref:Threonine--tRNA ligase n=1 Tax=Nocardioides marmotae TaxID=2663857 RepID=A0A6I3JGM7_9ACTN|nr:threonine--tRNA ligase [Nocardioides marmotae]MCR6033663.1 threonine--tRNA ligase [Gordonia jinghuaiqii]MBC9733561.1 threonine--tRNA ligase [Nocardioides marmotae]MTB84667.1 threonine--tRNA ligase [Nocardioides marmotae]MTB97321.1 threonine--tRNA ligase [Nocardioides marmotae]QKE01779.1 threonine--tRNA ligase [Nocardioides marmotae]
MSDIQVVLVTADAREERTTTTGTKAWELFAEDPSIIVARVNGELRDLSHELADGDEVEGVAIDSPDGLAVLRHSTAHVMAQAVQELFPDAKLGIGPPVTDGFYYDFDVETPFVPEDLEKIESRMRKIIKEGQKFSRRVTSDHDAIAELKDEPYKIELIGLKGSGKSDDAAEGASVEVGAGELTIYDNIRRNGDVAWSDLCRGPHLPTTKRIPAFKLMRTAAAYWRGNEKNKQLQRIYGTAWPSKEDLEAYLHRLEEAERRDHRKLGRDLDLFSFPDEIGSGLPVFHPKGGVIKRVMEDYVRQRHTEEGFEYVGTPHISKEGTFHLSGHLPYYADGMFPPMEFEGENYYLKAMNCPMHNLIYRSRGRSYRELPLRLFEFGHVYRYEKSGVIHGLTRVRGFAQDDSHSYCTPEQAPEEVAHLLSFMLGVLRDFGLDDFYLELSTRDDSKPDKFVGSNEQWETATKVLEQVCADSGLELVPDPGGAAFYGPKVSVQAKDAIGRTWQMGTVQYDFNQPEGFDLQYQAADGTRKQPVMIHSAKFGSIERFLGVLVEHYAGAFPPWLAPVQVQAIPIAERHEDYLWDVAKRMRKEGLRVEVDDSTDRMQKKIRNAQLQKVPFMMIAGDDDLAAGAVSFRYRDGRQDNGVPIEEAIARVREAVAARTQV